MSQQFAHHVFLSLRNKRFGDHLHTALLSAGISSFRGEVQNAIEESKILITVFSKEYASSQRCLDELIHMIETRRAFGHFLLPVFYHVDPSDVRKQKGMFEQPFVKFEEIYTREKVDQWRAALRQVADLGGMVLQVNG